MWLAVYAPLLTSALLGGLVPATGRLLRPAAGARLLLAAGVIAALTSAFALGVLAFTLVGQIPLVADVGGWSARSLRAHDPVAAVTATAAGLALTGASALLVRTCLRLAGTITRAGRACRRMSGEPGGMVVIDDPWPSAYAVPAGTLRIGRIVVSSGMLRALSPVERRALLAHESAHLRHRHHLYRMAATAVASLNPLLAGLPRAIEDATERWADEAAADEVGDRRVVARAVARAALAAAPGGREGFAPARFGDRDTARRVDALLAGPPARRRLPAVALCALLVVSVLTARRTLGDADRLLDRSTPVAHGVHHLKGRMTSD